MLGMMRRNRNTMSMFTRRTMSHSDSRPRSSGFLERHTGDGSGEAQAASNWTLMVENRERQMWREQGGERERVRGGNKNLPVSDYSQNPHRDQGQSGLGPSTAPPRTAPDQLTLRLTWDTSEVPDPGHSSQVPAELGDLARLHPLPLTHIHIPTSNPFPSPDSYVSDSLTPSFNPISCP